MKKYTTELFQKVTSPRLTPFKAFTLAEVLITLGIIGIVAAMTIPTLIQNQQNKARQAQLKKAHSVLSQALKLYQADNGSLITPNTLDFHELKSAIMPYLRVSEDCGFGSTGDADVDSACVPNKSYVSGSYEWKELYTNFINSTEVNYQYFDDGQFILNDGMLILIENPSTPKRLYISVDINGLNGKPNQLGHDLFMFQINNNGVLLPMGAEDTDFYDENDEYCSNSSSNSINGAGCTYKALYDKDYFENLPK